MAWIVLSTDARDEFRDAFTARAESGDDTWRRGRRRALAYVAGSADHPVVWTAPRSLSAT